MDEETDGDEDEDGVVPRSRKINRINPHLDRGIRRTVNSSRSSNSRVRVPARTTPNHVSSDEDHRGPAPPAVVSEAQSSLIHSHLPSHVAHLASAHHELTSIPVHQRLRERLPWWKEHGRSFHHNVLTLGYAPQLIEGASYGDLRKHPFPSKPDQGLPEAIRTPSSTIAAERSPAASSKGVSK